MSLFIKTCDKINQLLYLYKIYNQDQEILLPYQLPYIILNQELIAKSTINTPYMIQYLMPSQAHLYLPTFLTNYKSKSSLRFHEEHDKVIAFLFSPWLMLTTR